MEEKRAKDFIKSFRGKANFVSAGNSLNEFAGLKDRLENGWYANVIFDLCDRKPGLCDHCDMARFYKNFF